MNFSDQQRSLYEENVNPPSCKPGIWKIYKST